MLKNKILLTFFLIFGCSVNTNHNVIKDNKTISLRDKISQMIMIRIDGRFHNNEDWKKKDVELLVKDYNIGGLITYTGNIHGTFYNIESLQKNRLKLKSVKALLERIEAYIRAQYFVNINTSIKHINESKFISEIKESGLVRNENIPEAFNYSEKLKSIDVSLIIHKSNIVEMVDLLRSYESQSITINKPVYLFTEKCESYESLVKSMGVN